METNSLRAAFTRAARSNPAYRPVTLYRYATDTRGRPDPKRFVALAETYATVRWRDTDDRLFSEDVGDALVTLVAVSGVGRPDAIVVADGAIFVVKDAEGEDSLGAQRRYRVRRWSEATPPVIVSA